MVHVIPLLVETGQHEDFDLVVTVDADHETQIQRLMARNGSPALKPSPGLPLRPVAKIVRSRLMWSWTTPEA